MRRAPRRQGNRPHRPAPRNGRTPDSAARRPPRRADKLSRSRREIPEATVWVDVDATDLLATRRAPNAAEPARPVSLLALLARFTILGLRRYPELNARIEHRRDRPAGRGSPSASPRRPSTAWSSRSSTTRTGSRSRPLGPLAERTSAARAAAARPAGLTDGTFQSANNYGVFGVDGSAAIINHPEVAILGLGRIIDRPWVVRPARGPEAHRAHARLRSPGLRRWIRPSPSSATSPTASSRRPPPCSDM